MSKTEHNGPMPSFIQEEPSVAQTVIALLAEIRHPFRVLKHQPVYTMEEAARVCEHSPEQGVKVLLVNYSVEKDHREEMVYTLVVWSGPEKVDFKLLKKLLGVKKISMATPKAVQTVLGISVGALAPFGYTKKLPVIFDSRLKKEDELFINAGQHDVTVAMPAQTLITLIETWSSQVLYTE